MSRKPEPIRLRRSAVPGKIPTPDQIEYGEIAVNTHDGKIFLKRNKNNTDQVIEFIGNTPEFNIPTSNNSILSSNTDGNQRWLQIGTGLTISESGIISVTDAGNAVLLDGHPGSYYLDYGNFTNISETLDTVTDRGNITSNSITIHNMLYADNLEISENITVVGGDVNIKAGNYLKLYNPANSTFASIHLDDNNKIIADYPWNFTDPSGINVTGNLTIDGDFTVNGLTTTINTINLDIEDSIITLNKGQLSPLNDIGLLFQRYESANTSNYNVGIVWDETSDKLIIGATPEAGNDNDISFNATWMSIDGAGLYVSTALYTNDIVSTSGVLTAWSAYGGSWSSIESKGLNIGDWNNIPNYGDILVGTYNFDVLRDDGTSILTALNSGNVGIGTTSPASKLHVVDTNPNIQITRSSDFYYGQLSAEGFAAFTNTNASAPIIFKTATTERMRIDASGNVGIGTTSIPATLTIGGIAGVDRSLQIGSAGATRGIISTEAASGIVSIGATNDSTTGILTFRTGASLSENMRIDASGNVGIGENSPDARLHATVVSGSTGVSEIGRFERYTTGDNHYLRILVDNLNNVIQYDSSGTNSGGHVFLTGNTERVRFDAAGNVGIGTSSPTNKVHISASALPSIPTAGSAGHILSVGTTPYGLGSGVLGDGTSYLQSTRFDGTATNYNLLLQPNGGNVGIRNTVPVYPLDITGDVRLSGSLRMGSGQEIIWANGDASIIEGAEGNNYSLSFRTYNGTTNTTKMHILGNGNVGIGTTSPTLPLDINGSARASSFYVSSVGHLYGTGTTTTSTIQTKIADWNATAYGGAKVVVEAKDGVNRHITELLITHDGTTAYATEYASIWTSAPLAIYDVDISAGNVRLLGVSASTNSTVYKIMSTLLLA